MKVRLADGGEWEIVQQEHAQDAAFESVFAVGNGHLGIRGAPDEGRPAYEPGVILNGFHETWPIAYPEDAYGLARTGQTIVSPPDGSITRLFVDDEPFDLDTADVTRFERSLDMRAGVMRREVEFVTDRGQRLVVRSSRFVSLDDRHMAAIHYEVVALDASSRVAISSELVTGGGAEESDDPRRAKDFAGQGLVPLDAGSADGGRAMLSLTTRNSGLELACGIAHAVESARRYLLTAQSDGDHAAIVVQARLEPGESLRVTKYLAYHWAADAPRGDLAARANRTLDRAERAGYMGLEFEHRSHVADFWRRSDIQIDGAAEVQKAVRFNLFQLMQATARGEGLGVPAKGVTGRGYEGHYFWDTEIYVLPFLTHTTPKWARHALTFRRRMLDAARRRAHEVGHGGALFPWRTITGDEASAWYAAGTAQYHINADIAHAMHHYNRVTGDLDFMLDQGAEVLIETARFWMELGFFSERRDGQFSINAVTGPDEYTTVVDNNAYTNLMARENLEIAIRTLEWLQGVDPHSHRELVRATALTDDEVEGWRRAAALMFVPRDEQLGIVLQDERFLERKRWDFDNTPADRYPLLLHFHPLEIYRHQVIKQTDVVLATYLLGDSFSDDEKRRTFDYYDPLTTSDSSLSACIQSVMASEVGHAEAALDYFLEAAGVDLVDLHGNTRDGVHVASCGGTWLALVAGFGGLRDFDGEVRFAPRLPKDWQRLRFRIEVRGQLIEADLTHEVTTYTLVAGAGLPIQHFGEQLRLEPGQPVNRATLATVANPDVRTLRLAA
jgi:alpha,alpha-trehalose phosphorylase